MATGRQLVLIVLATGACERPASRPPRPDTPAAVVAAETLVRRVPIVYRRASAMQRVTPALQPLQALVPIDTPLVVRVLDQRGGELGGVPVRWALSVAPAGLPQDAALRVLNAVTDSLGLSSAVFTPGTSADPQGAAAEVDGVGRIEFLATVPAHTIRIATSGSVWAGEHTEVAATAVDYAGHLLRGGTLSWGTTDSTVLRAEATGATTARVRGMSAGSAEVVAWVRTSGVRASARIGVRPVASGRLMTLDGRPVPTVRLEVSERGARDTVVVRDGRFSRPLSVGGSEDVALRVVPATAEYHEARMRVPARDLFGVVIALVPSVWRIDAGSYRGQTVPVDAALALRRTDAGAPFWRVTTAASRRRPLLLGWRESDLPLRVAFNRARSRERISPDDSAQFWRIAEQLEADVGRRLFVPAEMGAGVVAVEITSIGGSGHTFITWNASGDQYDGVLAFQRVAVLRERAVVTHELLHLLGFGHSVSWPTIADPVTGRIDRLTPHDVAYVQMAMRLRRAQERDGAIPGLPLDTPPR